MAAEDTGDSTVDTSCFLRFAGPGDLHDFVRAVDEFRITLRRDGRTGLQVMPPLPALAVSGTRRDPFVRRGVGVILQRASVSRPQKISDRPPCPVTTSTLIAIYFCGLHGADGAATRSALTALLGKDHLGEALSLFGLERPTHRYHQLTRLVCELYQRSFTRPRHRRRVPLEQQAVIDAANQQYMDAFTADGGHICSLPPVQSLFKRLRGRELAVEDVERARDAAVAARTSHAARKAYLAESRL